MEKKIISFILSFFLCFNIVNADEVNIKSERAILYNLDDNIVLYEKDANTQTNIASLTKIMTVIVAIEKVEDYDKKIKITSEMVNGIAYDVTKAGLKKGYEVTFDDLLAGALLKSGADSVQALAIYSCGSIEKMVEAMNEKVKDLGLKNTKFSNVVGLYDKNNYSSAYDMAQILIYALKNEKFNNMFTTQKYETTYGKKFNSTITSYNKKAKKDIAYIKGSKTGYIKKAGYCLASIANINDVNYLLITLNAFNDSTAHIKDSVNLYDYYSSHYNYFDIVKEDTFITELNILNSNETSYKVYANYNKKLFLENTFDINKVTYKYNGINEINNTIKKGSKLGNVEIIYDEKVLDTFDVYLDKDIEYINNNIINYIKKYKKSLIITGILIFVIIVLFKIKNKLDN